MASNTPYPPPYSGGYQTGSPPSSPYPPPYAGVPPYQGTSYQGVPQYQAGPYQGTSYQYGATTYGTVPQYGATSTGGYGSPTQTADNVTWVEDKKDTAFPTKAEDFVEDVPLDDNKERLAPVQGYRDIPFLLAFILHLVAVLVIIGLSFASYKPPEDGENSGGHHGPSSQFDESPTLLQNSLITLVVCGVLGVVCSAVWLVLCQHFAKALIVVSLVVSVLMSFVFALWILFAGSLLWGIFALLFAAFYAFCAWTWKSRIPFAEAMLQAVSSVISSYPGTVRVAYASLPLQIGWAVLWMVGVAAVQQYSETLAYFLTVYLVFSFYWVSQVIKNVVHVTVAGTVATWYFMHGTVGVPPNPTVQSFKRATTTSFGSICFGSLITAVLRTIRFILNMFRGNTDNDVAAIIACIVECLIAALDSLIEYFNQYAYAQIAIYGKTYCQAAKDSWRLVHSHGLEAVVNDNLVGNVLSIACLITATIVGLVSGVMMYALEHDYYIQLGLIGFVVGFVLAMLALEVVESGVITIFVCFAEEPQALRRNNPALYQKLDETYNLSWTV